MRQRAEARRRGSGIESEREREITREGLVDPARYQAAAPPGRPYIHPDFIYPPVHPEYMHSCVRWLKTHTRSTWLVPGRDRAQSGAAWRRRREVDATLTASSANHRQRKPFFVARSTFLDDGSLGLAPTRHEETKRTESRE